MWPDKTLWGQRRWVGAADEVNAHSADPPSSPAGLQVAQHSQRGQDPTLKVATGIPNRALACRWVCPAK